MTPADEFREEIRMRFARAAAQGAECVEINSGDVHRALGGYPGRDHRMPVCCDVMYAEMTSSDEILSAPPKGKGAALTIRYLLPR